MLTLPRPRLRHHAQKDLAKRMDHHDHIAIFVRAGADLRTLPYGAAIAARIKAQRSSTAAGETLTIEAPNARGTVIAIGFVGTDTEVFRLHEMARRLTACKEHCRTIALVCTGLAGDHLARAMDALLGAALARAPLPSFRTDPKETSWPVIEIFGSADGSARTIAAAQGNHLARTLTALPGNHLTPSAYRKHIQGLARTHGWRYRFLDEKKLATLGAGAFLAVTQADRRGAGIAHLRYEPARGKGRALALVGKGICFDTGGVNIKPARHMYNMHEDMEGSAVALGTLLALTLLKVPFPVDCYLAIAENAVGPLAYRPNDVVRALNGTTIEIVHTDAEGRMVLADTLTLASRSKPGLIIDYATLTGACVYALGSRMSGGFSNRADYLPLMFAASAASGERVWPFPLPEDYENDLKSDVADIKQCTLEGEADHILAGLFLKRFVGEGTPWLHLDLAAGRHKGGLGLVPTDVSGFGVRFTLSLLLDQGLAW